MLKSLEGAMAFAVQGRHIDIENAHEGVGAIFYTGGFTHGGPRHALSYACLPYLPLKDENIDRNVSHFIEDLGQLRLSR